MSYTQFVSTATFTISEDFNLQSYLDAISERCVKEENFIFEFYGVDSNGLLDVDFANYVSQLGDNILIECDSEEINSDSEVWDWLIDQFLPVMTSEFAEIESTTVDSRSGVDSIFYLYGRDGKRVDLRDIVEVYKNAVKA